MTATHRLVSSGTPIEITSPRGRRRGLNLTAAEYVFLLDPWWNPAVEAQAIDRTHRIGRSGTYSHIAGLRRTRSKTGARAAAVLIARHRS